MTDFVSCMSITGCTELISKMTEVSSRVAEFKSNITVSDSKLNRPIIWLDITELISNNNKQLQILVIAFDSLLYATLELKYILI